MDVTITHSKWPEKELEEEAARNKPSCYKAKVHQVPPPFL